MIKLIIVLQFLFFSLSSIAQIEQDAFSKNLIFADSMEINTPISNEGQISSIADFSLKYIDTSNYFSIYEQKQSLALSTYTNNFKYIFPHPQLARSPPSLHV